MEAVFAVAGAAMNYLVIRSRATQQFSGIILQSEEGWAKIEKTITLMIQGVMK
ncbi:MAG: hypothetical protein GY808_19100 [Gammaproteobacteria bacterium]|nr:hypothetical protein [Gammaproteobacteria bacterium]